MSGSDSGHNRDSIIRAAAAEEEEASSGDQRFTAVGKSMKQHHTASQKDNNNNNNNCSNSTTQDLEKHMLNNGYKMDGMASGKKHIMEDRMNDNNNNEEDEEEELEPELARRVLIVDDDVVTRKTLKNFFKRLGFKVVTAEGARQSLKILHINAYLGELARQKRLSVDSGLISSVRVPATALTPPTSSSPFSVISSTSSSSLPPSTAGVSEASGVVVTCAENGDKSDEEQQQQQQQQEEEEAVIKRQQDIQRAIDSAEQEQKDEAAEDISDDDIGGEFDLLLIDVMMPDIDGIELLKIFKKASTEDIPIIMISSSEDPDVISQSFKSGAEDFLQKPIRFDILKRRVEMCLEDRKARKQEAMYKEKLRKEKETRDQLTRQVREQEKQLEQMRLQISDTIETPIQVVMKTISDLLKGSHSTEQYKGALLALMKSLGSRDLYRPSFSMVLDHDDTQLDDMTKKWLVSEFMSEQALADRRAAAYKELVRQGRQHELAHVRKNSLPECQITRSVFISLDSEHCFDELGQFKNTIPDLDKFTFNVLMYDKDELILNVAFMFEDLGLIDKFDLDRHIMLKFLRKVRSLYQHNPYHNFVHAIDVTQFCYACLCLERVANVLTQLDMLALLLAAVCHDVGHPGLNNNYQVSGKTELALLYNDMSVLENYHCATMFGLLLQEEYNFLSDMPERTFRELRKSIISAILATDMAHHFEISTKFQTRLQSGPMSKEHADDRQMLINILLKCADVSNVVRPFEACHRWADMLIEEFANQGDRERMEGMPISPNMDRSQIVKPKFQISFIDYIATPLYKTVASYITELNPIVEQLSSNRCTWQSMLQDKQYQEQQQQDEDKEEPSSVIDNSSLQTVDTRHGDDDDDDDSDPMITFENCDDVIDHTAKLRGFKVLIVEGNAHKRRPLEEVLERDGFQCDAVRNGHKAKNVLVKQKFDIVVVNIDTRSGTEHMFKPLEDIRSDFAQMPEKHRTAVPIVALVPVAHHAEAIHICGKYGVEKCLAKPVPVQQLLDTLEEVIAAATRNLPAVDMELAIEQCGVEREFIEELLNDFVEHGRIQIEAIEKAIAERDWDNLELNAHSIKGAAAQLAIKPTSQAAFALEKAAKLKKPDHLECDLQTLKECFAEVCEFVSSVSSVQQESR